jgi:hypothetical protein
MCPSTPNQDLRRRPRQEGIALLIAVLMLLMVSAIGVAAIDHAGEQNAVAGHARRTTITFYAADAGVEYGKERVFHKPPILEAFDVTLDDGQTGFRSGTRTDTSAQDVEPPDAGPPPDGFSINVGGSGGFVNQNTTLNVTATGPGNATVELEARVSQTLSGFGRY